MGLQSVWFNTARQTEEEACTRREGFFIWLAVLPRSSLGTVIGLFVEPSLVSRGHFSVICTHRSWTCHNQLLSLRGGGDYFFTRVIFVLHNVLPFHEGNNRFKPRHVYDILFKDLKAFIVQKFRKSEWGGANTFSHHCKLTAPCFFSLSRRRVSRKFL